MLVINPNGVTTQFDVAGEASPFLATQIANCLFWGREDFEDDGAGRVVRWFDKSGNSNNFVSPVPNVNKPLFAPNSLGPLPSFTTDGVAQYLSNVVYGPLFTGNDIPISVVTVFNNISVINNRVLYGLSGLAANPLHEVFDGVGQYQTNRRDDAGVAVAIGVSATIPPNTGRHILVDIFAGGATPTRTVWLDGVNVIAAACNVGICTFNQFSIGARLALGVPTLFSNLRVWEQAIYAAAITNTEALQYTSYARERYLF